MDSLIEPEEELAKKHLKAPWGELGRSATLGIVSLVSKFVLQVMNTFESDGLDKFRAAVIDRPEGVGLITVSNHTSTLDDPMLLSAMLPWRFFITEHLHKNVRWSLCAREICYRNPLLGQFFQSGKTLPIERGQGVGQPIMHVVASEVGKGSWVHVFPEGRINYNGKIGQLRWGVGKIFCDAVNANANAAPIILPFYHSGMGRILPKGGRLPRAGKQIKIYVGNAIPMEDLAERCRNAQFTEDQKCVWQDVVARITDALRSLETQGLPNPDQTDTKTHSEPHGRLEGALPAGDEV